MKKKLTSILSLGLITALLTSMPALANSSKDLITGSSFPIGSSNQTIKVGEAGEVEMVGKIEASILSVTMPTYVPFTISHDLDNENKVISPRIPVINNSSVPIDVTVSRTYVNLRQMPNTSWSDTGVVDKHQIAIGLKEEKNYYQMPENLTNTNWLRSNQVQDLTIMTLDPHENRVMYVVGALGSLVSDYGSFQVTPTFVVTRASSK